MHIAYVEYPDLKIFIPLYHLEIQPFPPGLFDFYMEVAQFLKV